MALEVEKVREVAERVARDLGLEVAEVEFRGGAGKGGRLLRIFIEKAGAAAHGADTTNYGVTHADCEAVSREVGTILDVEEAVPGGTYMLEVSSPGLDRKLTRAADFARFTGSRVKLMTREPVAENRHWEGRLESFGEGRLRLDVTPAKKKNKPAPERRVLEVELANVERANLVPEI
jgi:ribosome maturation factor RimP